MKTRSRGLMASLAGIMCLAVACASAPQTINTVYFPTPTMPPTWTPVPFPTLPPAAAFASAPTGTPQALISPQEASSHIGEFLTVKLAHAYCTYHPDVPGRPTFCNDAPYPDQRFALLAWDSDWSDLDGTCVLVTGLISINEGIPQIVAENRSAVQTCAAPEGTLVLNPGISTTRVMQELEQVGFQFQPDQPRQGQPTQLGRYDDSVAVLLIGPPDSLIEAQMTIWYDSMDKYTPSFPDLVRILAPDWQDGFLNWLSDTRGQPGPMTRHGNLQFQISYLASSGENSGGAKLIVTVLK